MAKKAKTIEAQEQAVREDKEILFRRQCLEKVQKQGYEAAFEGSVLMITLSRAQYEDEETKAKAMDAIRKTGYNASFGVQMKRKQD